MTEKEKLSQMRFRAAVAKLSDVSTQYQSGKIRCHTYLEQLDALVDASGWTREGFQAEVVRQRNLLANH